MATAPRAALVKYFKNQLKISYGNNKLFEQTKKFRKLFTFIWMQKFSLKQKQNSEKKLKRV